MADAALVVDQSLVLIVALFSFFGWALEPARSQHVWDKVAKFSSRCSALVQFCYRNLTECQSGKSPSFLGFPASFVRQMSAKRY
jgi:hypothetical protein